MGTNRAGPSRVLTTLLVVAVAGLSTVGPATMVGAADDGAAYDPLYDDPCAPANHPDWASDPYCNPALANDPEFFGPPLDGDTSPVTLSFDDGIPAPPPADRSSLTDKGSLTGNDNRQAVAVGANRMLLAIDALAELGAFERATQPGTGILIEDVRDSIPADGLTADGYLVELQQFVDDFVPFLDFLEMSGVEVSDDLWIAIDDLEFVGLEAGGLDSGSLAFLSPEPWINGVADLLVRGGETAPPTARSGDDEAIRAVLSQYGGGADWAVTEIKPDETVTASTTTAPPTSPATDPQAPVQSESSGFPMTYGAALLLAVAGAIVFLRRRSMHASARNRRAVDSGLSGSNTSADSRTTRDHFDVGSDAAGSTADASTRPPSVTDLLEASRRMTSSLDATSIADIALAEARRLVDAEGGIVVRRSPTGLDPVSCDPPMLFNYDHIADGCLPRVIETGRSTTSIATEEPLLIEVPMAMAAVPIVADGVVSGAILVVRVSARPFARHELDSLEMLAPLVGSAFAAADTHETATELVDVEPLTGLQNRRRLDLDLASISADEQIAYVMVDIDHFKNFNDTNGHAAGDEALRQVSALLAAAVRPRDLVYRYGGEEFCVLLPGATAQEASEVAERARAAVESALIPGMENQPDGKVTISVGVSDSAWGTPDDLAERADAALYRAKRNGRNQVALHQA